MIQAARFQKFVLGSAGCSVSRRADMFRDIQSSQADTATGIVNQHGFVLLQSAHRNQQRPGCQVIHRNCRALFEGDRVRLCKDLRDRRDHQLSLSTKARHCDDRVADEIPIASVADCFNRARDFITHHARLRRAVGVQALARENVGKVQAGGFDAHQYLSVTRNRVGTLLDLQSANIAIACGYDCSHEKLFSGAARRHYQLILCAARRPGGSGGSVEHEFRSFGQSQSQLECVGVSINVLRGINSEKLQNIFRCADSGSLSLGCRSVAEFDAFGH